MTFTKDEKALLKSLVEKHLEQFKAEGDTIIEYTFPGFKAGEERYEDFVEALLKKLK